jgi:hypothetical protein
MKFLIELKMKGRPLVKISSSDNDFSWYENMISNQHKIIELHKKINKIDNITIKTLEHCVKVLEKINTDNNNKVFVFRPLNLFKRKKNVGN